MKRLLAPLAVCLALAVPVTALAAQQYAPTRSGYAFASKAVTGSCTASRSKLLGTATLRCSGNGTATVRYAFTLPSGCGPSVMPWVDAIGPDSYGVNQKAGKVSLWVRTSGPSRVIISSVSLRYYCY
jgi:hypothetical protein